MWARCVQAVLLALVVQVSASVAQKPREDRFGVALPARAIARLESAHLRSSPTARGDQSVVWSVAVSSTGLVVSGGYHSEKSPIRYWDSATGMERPGPSTMIPGGMTMVFSPDGRTLVVSYFRDATRAYDPLTGRVLYTLQLPNNDNAGLVTFAPDGQTLATSVFRGSGVHLWDAKTGKHIGAPILEDVSPTVMRFSPDGKLLAIACSDGTVRVWDVANGKESRRIEAHERYVTDLAFVPGGTRIATLGPNEGLRYWDPATGRAIGNTIELSYAGKMAFAPDGKTVLVDEGGVTLRDASSGRLYSRVRNPRNLSGSPTETPAFTADGKFVVWADRSPYINVARVENGQLHRIDPEPFVPRSLCFTENGKQLIIISAGDPIVRYWDVASTLEQRRFPAPAEGRRVRTAPGGRVMALACADGKIYLCDSQVGRVVRSIAGDKDGAGAFAIAPDGRSILVARGQSVRWCDTATGLTKADWSHHTGRITDVLFSRDGKFAVSASEDRTVCVWRIGDGALQRVQLDCPLASLALSADDALLAGGDWEGNVHLWDMQATDGRRRLKLRAKLSGHGDNVSAVAFAPGGKLLASASWDATVRLWDCATARERAILRGHKDEVYSLAFSRDGRLASGSGDRTILIWDVSDQ